MLVLSRKTGESVRIGGEVRITVVSVSGGQVRLAVEAPDSVTIHREEVFERIALANQQAASAALDDLGALEEAAAEKPGREGGERGWRSG